MIDIRSAARPLARIVLTAALGASTVLPTTATILPTALGRVAGSYVATRLSGKAVVRLELSLARDGRARLVTGSSRYSQRPTGVDNGTVVETGTWRIDAGRVVLHIEKALVAGADDKERPAFADRTFTIARCELQLVGSALAFDKQHCGV